MSTKIKPIHLERVAYVYVRQSSMHQVRNNLESKRRQYELEEKAKRLGFGQVVVIDEDLGRSGSGSQERPGFGRLLAAVCEGQVGAVFALEASRLARNNRDWHHLVDLCALTETVLVDGDGVYDPRQTNDRLLLGLKGSMSEYELGILRQRAREAFLDKVRRGAVMWEVPVGYVRTEDDRIEKSPDRQVQQAIATVFAKFRELGSARQVTLWYCDQKIPVPGVVPATKGREIAWQPANATRVRKILKNPYYAGAFAYGKTKSTRVIRDGRARVVRKPRPIEEWTLLIRDHHPGYISWDDYMQNRKLLEANQAKWGGESSGAPREGSALLAGLLRCARCGRKLRVNYSGRDGHVSRYQCQGRGGVRGDQTCTSMGGMRIDQAVSEQILEAIQPVGIDAAIQAVEEESKQQDEAREALELALERAHYETRRTQRQYDAADPENRLVAAELEARWNSALQEVSELQSRLQEAAVERPNLTTSERQQLFELANDLPLLWNHPEASVRLKKRIARVLLKEIFIGLEEDPPEAVLSLHWSGGVHTELRVPRTPPGRHRRSADRDLVDLVRDLAKICRDKEIARILNRLGYRTGQGLTWRGPRVQSLRRHHRISASSRDENWLTLEQATQALRISDRSVLRLIKAGILPAKQTVAYAPWVIERKDLNLLAVREAVRAVRARVRKRRPPTHASQMQLPFSQGQGEQ